MTASLQSPIRRRALLLLFAVLAGIVPFTVQQVAGPIRAAAATYETTVEASSPVAYWELGEGSGNLSDSSGNGNTATAHGTVTYGNAGPIDGDGTTAVSLDGTSAYAEAADSTSLDSPTSDITLEAWVKPTSGQFGNGNWRFPIQKSNTSFSYPYFQYGLGLNDTTSYPNAVDFELAIGSTRESLMVNDTGWAYGSWNPIVATYDGSAMRIYVDGVQVGYQAQTGTINSYASPLDLGAYPEYTHDSSVLWKGGLAQAAVYSTALSSATVESHYEYAYNAEGGADSSTSPYTNVVTNDSPAAYWRLDEASPGPIFRDRTSNHNDQIAASAGVTYAQGSSLITDSDKSISLDGSTGFTRASDSSSLDPTSQITLEGWANPTTGSASGSNFKMIIDKASPDLNPPYQQYGLGLNDGSYTKAVSFSIVVGGSLEDLICSNSGWVYGSWNHVVGTYDGSHMWVYVNGKPVCSQSQTGSMTTYSTMADIGGYANWPKNSTYLFEGGIDDVAVYPAALSAAHVASHYLASGNTPAPTNGALTAAESPTGCGCAVGTSADPINTQSGNFFHTFTDVSIPGRSYPLAIQRTYNSQNASVNGPFGYGWTYNYGMSLAVTGSSPNQVATITQEDGSQVPFDQPASGSTWTPASAAIATLVYNSGSSTWTYVRQGRDTYTFNSSGEVTAAEDLNGYSTSFTYTSGKLTTVTDPAGRTLTLAWTGSNITSVTDANVSPNRTVSYAYDGSGNLQDVTDVNGGDTNFTYSSHLMTVMKDPVCEALGGSCPGVQNHYNGSNQVDWQKDQLNRETTFSYSGTPGTAAGGSTTITDPSSNVTVDGYQWGVRTYETKGYGTGDAATTRFMYDPSTLALTGTMDPNGNVSTTTVDSSGNVLTKTDADGNTTTSTYNALNEPLTIEDPNGVTTTNVYDGGGNLTSTSTPLVGAGGTATNCKSPSTAVAIAAVTCYAHTNGTYPGDVTSMTDPNGKITYYHYDSNGYRDQVKDPLGNVTGTVHNAIGWVTASYSPKAACTWNSSPPTGCSGTYETQYSYIIPGGSTTDEFGDVQTVTDPLSHVTTDGYDADRNKTSVKDGNSNTTTYTFDVANELTTTTRPDSTTQVTEYNDDGTVKDQKDGKGNKIISYGYNSLAEVTSTTDALSNVTDFTYDAAGNLLSKSQGSSDISYAYDPANRLCWQYLASSISTNPCGTVPSGASTYSYDADGQRTGMVDGTGTSSWTFDSLHRMTAYTNGNSATVTYGYGSDLKNQVATIAYPNSVGTVTQTWNDDGTLASTEDWNSKTVTFGYDANANLHTTTDPSTTNVTDTFGFNAADQMTSVSDSNGSTLFSATYTRDSNGQLSSDNSQAANQQDYKYTSLSQLCYAGSSSSNACGSPPASSYPYAFDSADNLTTNNGTAQQYNAADELCWSVSGSSANACGTVPTGGTSYNYDNSGNQTSAVPSAGSATCYAYSQENLMTSVKTGTGSSCSSPTTVGTYAYDGSGLRESKTVSGTTTQFTWDGAGGNLLQQYDGTTKTSYIYGPGGLPVEQIAGSTTTYLHHDQIGSTRLITDSAGATGTATTVTYDPYGNSVSTSGSLTTNLQFSGQYFDGESGLYYLRARYYNPTTAQFMTVDPAVSTTLAPFAYVAGNPLNRSDPSGKDWQTDLQNCVSDPVLCSLQTPFAVESQNVANSLFGGCNGTSDASTGCIQTKAFRHAYWAALDSYYLGYGAWSEFVAGHDRNTTGGSHDQAIHNDTVGLGIGTRDQYETLHGGYGTSYFCAYAIEQQVLGAMNAGELEEKYGG